MTKIVGWRSYCLAPVDRLTRCTCIVTKCILSSVGVCPSVQSPYQLPVADPRIIPRCDGYLSALPRRKAICRALDSVPGRHPHWRRSIDEILIHLVVTLAHGGRQSIADAQIDISSWRLARVEAYARCSCRSYRRFSQTAPLAYTPSKTASLGPSGVKSNVPRLLAL